jgi:uncharacterized LabA/DUF88 family protein
MKNNNKKSKEIRAAVYIDGSNFYYKLKDSEVKNITYFGYGALADWLAQKRKIVAKRYYVGVVRAKEDDKKAKQMQESQVRLFNHLQSRKEGYNVQRGYLMKSDGVYHEKGVDVKIAVDLLVGAYEDIYDVAILISSDTDLIPAIKKVKQLGKEVEYVGFSHKPSYGLIKNANETRLLTKNEIEQFQTARPV